LRVDSTSIAGRFDTQDAVQATLPCPQIASVLRDVSNFFPEAPEILIGEVVAQAV
jgi:hypothetical protein